MIQFVSAGRKVACGLVCLSLCSCVSIEHSRELQEAQVRVEHATGVRPGWELDTPLRELPLEFDGTLTARSAIELALTNNRGLRADLEVIGQAKAELVQAGLPSNPMFSTMLRFPDGGGLPDFAFGLSKDFADLWLIPSRKQAAQAMLQQRVLSFADAAIRLVAEVKTQYALAQYQRLAQELLEQNLVILRNSMEIAEARLRAGQAPQLDLNLLQGRYLETELELLDIRGEHRVTQQMLMRLMGVARAPMDWRPQPLSLTAAVPRITGGDSDFVEAALLQRLDVQAADWELASAAADFEQQRLRVIQNLGIGLSGERMQRRAQLGRKILADTARASIKAGKLTAPDIMSAGQRRLERSQMINTVLGPSLDVSLPVFDQNQAQIAKAQYRARELQQRYEEIEQRVAEEVRSAAIRRRLAEDKAYLYRDSLLPLQESNLRLAQTTYQAGQESILTVLTAQEALIRTQLGYAAAMRDLTTSAADLERQLAGRIPEFMETAVTSQPAEPGADAGETIPRSERQPDRP
jgi:outer membrane protein, heavy metal efflux system